MSTHHDDHPHTGHVVPINTYLLVFTALLVLTALTVWVAFIDLGAMNDVVAMAIATAKASVIVLYFMHLRYTTTSLTRMILIVGIFWVALLIVGIVDDYMTRDWIALPGR
jgi:cytochrome c oxidase subunit 4